MNDNNIYSIRCQLYNHKGPGFVIEINQKNNEFLLYHQEDENNPDKERVRLGRIDFSADFNTKNLNKSDVEIIISKAKKIKVPLVPPLTGGFDGAEHKIWILNGMSIIHASWWMDSPPQWEQINELWKLIVETKNT